MNDTQALKESEKKDSKYKKQMKSLLAKKKLLMEMGETFTIEVVNGNYALISKLFNQRTFKKGEYTTDELKFIRDVRRYIIKDEIYLKPQFQENQVFAEDVHYVSVATVPEGHTFVNVCEVDIDQAYWETAYQLEIIDEKLYHRGSKGSISKKARLTALGSLAKKKYRYHYTGDKYEQEVDSEPLLENLWFTICKRVSDVMHEVIDNLGKDFIFYWVDGIYMMYTSENVSTAMDIFMKHGYNSKFKKINQIHFHDKGFTVNDYGEIKRNFTYPNYTKKGKKARKVKVNYSANFKLARFANEIVNGKASSFDDFNKEEDGDK